MLDFSLDFREFTEGFEGPVRRALELLAEGHSPREAARLAGASQYAVYAAVRAAEQVLRDWRPE